MLQKFGLITALYGFIISKIQRSRISVSHTESSIDENSVLLFGFEITEPLHNNCKILRKLIMKISRSRFGKKSYLKPSVLEKRGLDSQILTITKVDIKLFGRDEKVVVHFKEKEFPPLICNATQTETLLDMFGEESKGWLNKQISIRLEDAFNPQTGESCKTIMISEVE